MHYACGIMILSSVCSTHPLQGHHPGTAPRAARWPERSFRSAFTRMSAFAASLSPTMVGFCAVITRSMHFSRMKTPQHIPRLFKYFMIPSHRHEQLERGLEDRGVSYYNHRELVFQVNDDLTTISNRLENGTDTNDGIRHLHRIKMFLM